jgi:hypothetical protein
LAPGGACRSASFLQGNHMAFAEDMSVFMDESGFAEAVVVNAVTVSAIVDLDTQVALSDVLYTATTLLLPASAVPAAAEGQACTVRGAAYLIRQVLQEPPDGALVRLVLVKV